MEVVKHGRVLVSVYRSNGAPVSTIMAYHSFIIKLLSFAAIYYEQTLAAAFFPDLRPARGWTLLIISREITGGLPRS